MNLHMAQESVTEHEDDIAELTTEKDELKDSLDMRVDAANGHQNAMEAAESAIQQQKTLINTLETAIGKAQAEGISRMTDLVLVIAIHREALSHRTEEWQTTTKSLRTANATIGSLQKNADSFHAAISRVDELSWRLEEIEAAQSILETELYSTRECLQTATHEGRTLRDALDETKARLSAAEKADAANTSSLATVAELEGEILSSQERMKGLEADVETPLTKLAVVEKARTDTANSVDVEITGTKGRTSELENAESRFASLRSELDTLIQALAAGDETHTEAILAAEERIAAFSEAERDYIIKTENLENQLTTKSAELEAADKRAQKLETDMAGLAARQSATEEDIEARQATIDELRERLQRTEEASAASAVEHEQLQSLLNNLEIKLATSITHENALQSDVVEMTDRHEKAMSAAATMRGELEALRSAASEYANAAKASRMEVEKLEKEGKHNTNMLKLKDAETQRL